MLKASGAEHRTGVHLTWFGVLVPLVFAALVLAGISQHELWRDEAKAWLIARHSHSLIDLFNNRRYEGHPVLWYALLYFASRFTANPLVMQLLHALIATAAIVVFVVRAPFGKVEKALFAVGLFPFYEYAVVSRNYALGILLLFASLAVFASSRRRPFLFAFLLAALANTSLYGLFLAIALALAWMVRDVARHQWADCDATAKMKDLLAATIVMAGCAAAFFQIVPPAPVNGSDAKRLEAFSEERFTGVGMREAVSRVWDSFVPIPTWRYRQFYGNILRAPNEIALTARWLAGLGILAAVLVGLRRSPAAFVFFAVTASAIILLEATLFDGGLRHHGHLFIAMIGALWLFCAMTDKPLSRPWNVALLTLLSIQACVGVWYWSSDLGLPFSPSREAADLLKKRYGRDFDLIADPANYASPIEAYLDVPVYFPTRRGWGTYEILDGTAKRATPSQLKEALRDVLAQAKRPVVLLSLDPVTDAGEGIELVPLASEPWSLSWEGWNLYEVRRRSDNPAGRP